MIDQGNEGAPRQPRASLLLLSGLPLQAAADKLDVRSLSSLHQACKAGRDASRAAVRVLPLDRHPLVPWDWQELPPHLLDIIHTFPRIQQLQLPGGWRPSHLIQVLHAQQRTWSGVLSLDMHICTLSPSSGAAVAAALPRLQHLGLFLHLPHQPVSRKAWRLGALRHLSALNSLMVETPLGADALATLQHLPHLQHLDLSPAPATSEPAASLAALAALTSLTSLRFCWVAGRSMTTAAPLAALTRLKSLHVFIGTGDAFPPCSGRPLPDLLGTLGRLPQLEELQLLQGLRLLQDFQGVTHLAALTRLQVLGLHDSLLRQQELQLMAHLPALRHLLVDSIQILGHQAAPGDPLVSLPSVEVLAVNVLALGGWQLQQLFPRVTQLQLLPDTLDRWCHGASLELPAVVTHSALTHLALCYRPPVQGRYRRRTTCTRPQQQQQQREEASLGVWCVTGDPPASWWGWASGWAAQLLGWGHRPAPPCRLQQGQVVQLLQQMPALQQLEVWLPGGSCVQQEPHLGAGVVTSSSSSSGGGGSGSSSSSTATSSLPPHTPWLTNSSTTTSSSSSSGGNVHRAWGLRRSASHQCVRRDPHGRIINKPHVLLPHQLLQGMAHTQHQQLQPVAAGAADACHHGTPCSGSDAGGGGQMPASSSREPRTSGSCGSCGSSSGAGGSRMCGVGGHSPLRRSRSEGDLCSVPVGAASNGRCTIQNRNNSGSSSRGDMDVSTRVAAASSSCVDHAGGQPQQERPVQTTAAHVPASVELVAVHPAELYHVGEALPPATAVGRRRVDVPSAGAGVEVGAWVVFQHLLGALLAAAGWLLGWDMKVYINKGDQQPPQQQQQQQQSPQQQQPPQQQPPQQQQQQQQQQHEEKEKQPWDMLWTQQQLQQALTGVEVSWVMHRRD